jgi:hypothetical protein
MATTSANLGIFYSGAREAGQYNNSPTDSIGGFCSTVKIPNLSEDALFDELGVLEASRGQVDYRCIFLLNQNATTAMANLTLTLTDPNSALVQFGTIDVGVELPTDAESPVQLLSSVFEEPRNIEWVHTAGNDVVLSASLAAGASLALWIRRTVNPITVRNLNAQLTFLFSWT